MAFEIKKRRGIFVYLYHLKQSKQLRKYGSIQYVSRRMKYVLLYLDSDQVEQTLAKLKQLRYVKDVVVSQRPELPTSFDNSLGKFKLTEEDQEKFKSKE